MSHWQARTALILGESALSRLADARVAVLGLGGVGGSAAEALCRAGVGHLLLVDHDTVDETNLNRQLFATRDVLGKKKCLVAKQRLSTIHPEAEILAADQFYLPDNCNFLFDFKPDYVVDAIDTVTAKLHLAKACWERGIPLIACLGTGNRLDPSKLTVGDIADTSGCGCPLARVLRRELKKQGVPRLRVVFSTEQPLPAQVAADSPAGRHSPGSSPFVTPAEGCLLASVVVRDCCQMDGGSK